MESIGSLSRASTGLLGLDKLLDSLRLGDNVVWQVGSVEDYKYFVRPFVDQALEEKRQLIYIRFGQHGKMLRTHPGIKEYQLNPDRGFEAFSTEVHNIVANEGQGVFYVFDCLSDLLSSWATDLMIGNFFKVICPYLFKLNTIAYFAIIRNRNSYDTIVRIRETTQLLLDVYRDHEKLFLHPLKVWQRYSPTMFLPHVSSGQDFMPVTSSMEASRMFSTYPGYVPGNVERKLDYWDRVFLKAQELLEDDTAASILEKQKMLQQLCKMMIGKDHRIVALVQKYFSLEDLMDIRSRLIGSGFIGGKSVGMLLARKILTSSDNDWNLCLEAHDSFYIGSDLFYTYLVENNCWDLRLEQKKEEHYFTSAVEIKQRIMDGIFPEFIRGQFYQMLEYFGQSPIIIRSSSLLEDGFGNAFAGKYESIFCVNQGNPQERYDIFEAAVKKVYASTMNEDALAYRQQRGLAETDEQMALLVQRVSGAYHKQFFFPDLAGVAMSHNPYVWKEDMDFKAGMLRLVLGLGTRAVDRVDDDYPRLVALDKPLLQADTSPEGIRKFSQHKVDVLDTVLNDWDTLTINKVASLPFRSNLWHYLAVPDHETGRKMRELGLGSQAWIINFEKLLRFSPVVKQMKKMLHILEDAYSYPVDIEFTINFGQDDKMQINLLQCRPLQTIKPQEKAQRELKVLPQQLLFSSKGNFMGNGIIGALKNIIYIQDDYINLIAHQKYLIARLVGVLNNILKNSGPFMLIGPGRWGTTMPSLGIPVSFSEICNTSVLVEVAVAKEGYIPELSFGTHFFQDLVETQISYVAIYPDQQGVTYNRDFLLAAKNSLADLLPEFSQYQHIVKLIDMEKNGHALYLDIDWQARELMAYWG